MKLTYRQQEKAIAVRELLNQGEVPWSERVVCPDGDTWFAFVDCTRALGKMIDGLDEVKTPNEMRVAFDAAWKAYICFWGAEHQRLLNQALGHDAILVDKVKGHRNGKRIVNRILERIKKSNGGTISTGINAAAVEVVDILEEEMGNEWMME